MIIICKPEATDEQIAHIEDAIRKWGLKPHTSRGIERTVIGVIGPEEVIREKPLGAFPGVADVTPVMKPYKLTSYDFTHKRTVIEVGKGVRIGDQTKVVLMSGPCSVESREQILEIAKIVKKAGASVLRGGAFKPRTSPYTFQGLGKEGLKLLAEAREATGLPVITELMDTKDTELVVEYADIIQIGARNMQNFSLLKEVGRCKKPAMLKRGMAATIKDVLLSAEYILSEGNMNVMLCERGIRTFETYTRNTLDLSAVPALKKESHLPVIVDPTHGAGHRELIPTMALAAVAAGADGIMVEVHNNPEAALSDGDQAMLPDKFDALVAQMRAVAVAIGKTM
ncbi:MAG TPA: 3-deoxy-7-phosphoheptulonate synthase [Verrucomicrobiae bacterium]|nr:3-deoxy-7-phosphoheptulonate synthase [Verrucomicrobiae bacterium]